jgi:hypothetical protein
VETEQVCPIVTQPRVWTKPRSASDWLSYALLAGGVAFVAFMAYSVYLIYSPLLWVDQWTFLEDVIANHGRYGAELLWKQHNEHRIPLPKLFYLADLYLFGGKNLFLHASVIAVQLAQLALLAVVFKRIGELRADVWRTAVAVATVCLFALRQSENFWWGWNLAMILPYLGATIAFSNLGFLYLSMQEGRRGALRYLLWSWAGVLIASLSLSYGLMVWPVLVVTMLGWRFPRRLVFGTAAMGAALIAIWLSGHSTRVEHHAFPTIPVLIRFLLVFYGSSWSCVNERLGMAVAMIALPASAAAYVWVLFKRQKDILAVVLLSLAMFVIATSALIAVGRFWLGLEQARTDRYQTGAMLFWCCVFVLVVRQSAKVLRAPALTVVLQAVLIYVLISAAQIAPLVAAGARVHANRIKEAAAALEAGVNDSSNIMYVALPPYRAEDILLMSGYLRRRHWSIFNNDRSYPLGREFRRFYNIVPSVACRGTIDSIRGIADYRWSGFRFSGWAYDAGGHAPARGVALVDSSGRLVGLGRSGFRRMDAPAWAPADGAGFLGYVPADLKTREVRAFAILADDVSACPLVDGQPLHLDLSATAYSGLESTGATIDLTRDLRPAMMNFESVAGRPVSPNSQQVVVGAGDEILITGWIVDSNQRAGTAADLVVDDIPLRAEYGYERPDVANFLSSPKAIGSGFKCQLPKLSSGEHQIGMRVIPKGMYEYCEGGMLRILVR